MILRGVLYTEKAFQQFFHLVIQPHFFNAAATVSQKHLGAVGF